jgi:hypothetical protein
MRQLVGGAVLEVCRRGCRLRGTIRIGRPEIGMGSKGTVGRGKERGRAWLRRCLRSVEGPGEFWGAGMGLFMKYWGRRELRDVMA